MSFTFSCPHCDQHISAEPEHSGVSGECPTCKQPIVVPDPAPQRLQLPPVREAPAPQSPPSTQSYTLATIQTGLIGIASDGRALREAQRRIGAGMGTALGWWFAPVVSGGACNWVEKSLVSDLLKILGREASDKNVDALFW